MTYNKGLFMEPKKQMKLKNKDIPVEKVELPQQNIAALEEKLSLARNNVQTAFQNFHKILLNKKLESNKSDLEKDNERKIADILFNSAVELNKINLDEGTLVAASIGLRELLKMRDRMNEIEYTALVTKKELNELQKELGVKQGK